MGSAAPPHGAGPPPRPADSGLHWWGTLLYVPMLYGLGWLASRPLGLLFPGWRPDQVNLAGVAIALLLLLLSLPWRLRRAWGESHPWQRLGLLPCGQGMAPEQVSGLVLRALARGLLKAGMLLVVLTVPLLLLGHARWRGDLSSGELWNALALVLGVGFAEELLFRGWLWGELELLVGQRRALSLQARIFALVHPWYRLVDPADLPHGFVAAIALVVGLILLGSVLAVQRRADGGLLWGAVGLHGGLVGGWFALHTGLLEISPSAPAWLVGPGAGSANPIGGGVGLVMLLLLLAIRRRRSDQPAAAEPTPSR